MISRLAKKRKKLTKISRLKRKIFAEWEQQDLYDPNIMNKINDAMLNQTPIQINYENSGTNKAKLVIDRSSSLVLTSNCYLTNFENEDETNSNITFGRYNIYVNGNPVN